MTAASKALVTCLVVAVRYIWALKPAPVTIGRQATQSGCGAMDRR